MLRRIPGCTAALLALFLAACGGGGGDSGSTDTPAAEAGDLTATNYEQTAQVIQEAVAVSTGTASSFSPVRASGTTGAAVSQAMSAALKGHGGRRVTLAGRALPADVVVDTVSCSGGGTVKTTFDDKDGSGEFSAGDVISFEFFACRESRGTVNGKATLQAVFVGANRVSVQIAYADFQAAAVGLNLQATYDVQWTGDTFTSELSVTQGRTVTSNGTPVTVTITQSGTYNASSGVQSTSTRGSVGVDGKVYTIDQPLAYTMAAGEDSPAAGSLSILDRDNDKVLVIAKPAAWRYEYHRVGNTTGTPDSASEVPKP